VITQASLAPARGQAPDDEPAAPAPTAEEQRLLGLFTASTKKIDKGRLTLVYDFESQQKDLVFDWKPDFDEKNMRMRWARGIEGTATTVEHGIVIGDFGEWIHKGVFLADGLEVTVDTLSVAQWKPGNVCGPVLFNEKKKQSLGVSAGFQCVVLRGFKLAKKPHPAKEQALTVNQRYTQGFKIARNVLEAYYGQKKMNDTVSLPKFTEGFDKGHVGLAWSGSVQSFVFKVTISGRLDPEWVAKQLGTEVKKSGKSGPPKAKAPSSTPATEPAAAPKK
jgi:hypothetical protein